MDREFILKTVLRDVMRAIDNKDVCVVYSEYTCGSEFMSALEDSETQELILDRLGWRVSVLDRQIRVDRESGFTRALQEARDRDNYIGIGDWMFLASRDFMIKEQEGWADGDEAKNIDFGIAPYWVTSDDGMVPCPIHNEEDLEEILRGQV